MMASFNSISPRHSLYFLYIVYKQITLSFFYRISQEFIRHDTYFESQAHLICAKIDFFLPQNCILSELKSKINGFIIIVFKDYENNSTN